MLVSWRLEHKQCDSNSTSLLLCLAARFSNPPAVAVFSWLEFELEFVVKTMDVTGNKIAFAGMEVKMQ